jgi:hypothetical protein
VEVCNGARLGIVTCCDDEVGRPEGLAYWHNLGWPRELGDLHYLVWIRGRGSFRGS